MLLKNSMRNAIVAAAFQVFSLLLSFANRIIVTRLLGVEYLGINGVFSNIVTLFSVAEGGINFAIIFAMYGAFAKAQDDKLIALIRLFQKIYTIIGLIVLALGLSLIPFLDFFIGDAQIDKPVFIYILFLATSAVPYFFASKKSVISVAQKEYLVTTLTNVAKLATLAIQTCVLLILKNYLVYLSVALIVTVVSNAAIVVLSYKIYPQQRTKEKHFLSAEEKKVLFADVRALVIANISGIIFSSTDSIIISHWLGLKAVGIYSNYFMIYNSLYMMFYMGINAITASVGSLNATSDKAAVYANYRKVFFLTFLVMTFFVSEMLVSYQDVIAIAFGEDLLLTNVEMLFMCLNFVLVLFRLPTLVFRNALGIFKYDRYKGVFEVAINLVLSIVLVNYIGILGVLLGTFVSTMMVSIWIEPLMLYKHGYNINFGKFFSFVAPYSFFAAVIIASAYFWNYSPLAPSYGKIAAEWVVTGIVSIALFFVFFGRREESGIIKNMLDTLKAAFHKKRNK